MPGHKPTLCTILLHQAVTPPFRNAVSSGRPYEDMKPARRAVQASEEPEETARPRGFLKQTLENPWKNDTEAAGRSVPAGT